MTELTPTPRRTINWIIYSLTMWLILIGLAAYIYTQYRERERNETAKVAILTLNDVYRINGIRRGEEGGLARVATARRWLEEKGFEVLVLHAGDLLAPSLLSNMYEGKQMVDAMNLLDGVDSAETMDGRMFVTFGNHEFDESDCNNPDALVARVKESRFYWLAGNLDFSRCPNNVNAGFSAIENMPNILKYKILKIDGIKFGLFGLTLQEEKYKDLLSDEDKKYTQAARKLSSTLRAEGAEFVIAVTHLNAGDDKKILDELGPDGPDLIIGGHDHTKMEYHSAGGTSYYKQTADARDIGIMEFTKTNEKVTFEYKFKKLDLTGPTINQMVQQTIEKWLDDHETAYCKKENLPANCLADNIGTTSVSWDLEEIKNRERETVIGNWLAGEMVKTTITDLGACKQADTPRVGVLGSGSLRLNFDLPAGYQIQRREIAELFTYDMPIIAFCTNGAVLKANLANGLGMPGAGRWPHTSGMTITYSPPLSGDKATIHEVQTSPNNLIGDDDPVLVFANSYVAAGGSTDKYNWGICLQDELGKDWSKCEKLIIKQPSNIAMAAQKKGKNFDLKAWMLTDFSGADPIGPDGTTTTGQLIKK